MGMCLRYSSDSCDGPLLQIYPITTNRPVLLPTVGRSVSIPPESSPDNSITSLYEGANWSQPSASWDGWRGRSEPGRRLHSMRASIHPLHVLHHRYEKGPLTRPLLVANKCLLNTFQNFSPASSQLISWAHRGRFPRENHSKIHPPLIYPRSTFGSLGCTRNSVDPPSIPLPFQVQRFPIALM
ncbi:hypothetical protein NPIL_338311 [Nephila pilipes]|uniref:Uncharacterized protein n=1 Tax=Nephila pilipes TaxID=299642 RepID=A0A8X6PXZ2_NEPPI|nr:hypothetical protein NPIL_338311 [Nephila pilipes]